ncbi:vWA domain-containing protein [Neobacillus citreus]|uniref:VWA domain-containing protein n=1 Tax=Neobacillus citreus TaxID=2833578 RepID=A0A942YB81_9BACI|nr:vWA domain-containing protein [Neobacillus citreus]MCH6269266.1 VWA domain-containing protein [Neobacillus citreus]
MLKKWIYLFAVFVFILSTAGGYRAEATTQMELSSRIEGVLVVDVSKSMLSSDPNGLSNEAMKMFVDMSSIKGDKIGVIAYGNDVESKKELTKIQTEADKQAIKGFIDSLGKYNNTDISVGVAEALKFLDTGHESGYIPLVVVLADGNNDLDKTKPKTNQQADEQLAQSVVDAKAKGYPIYVIGLNADGKLNKQLLKNIAAGTNGKFFETNNAADLPGILSEIFADHLKLKMVPVKDVTATEEFQDVPFTVPNENVLEANISLISSKPVELKLVDPSGKEVAIPSDNISLTKSKNYSMLKLLNPVQGNWTLKVKGFPQDKVDVKLVFNNDLQLKLAPLAKNIKAGNTVKIEAFFEDNGKKIVNKDLYPTLKANLYVKDSASGKTEEVPLKAGDKGFFGEFKAGDANSYEVTVRAEGNSFFRETKPLTIEVAATSGKDIEPVAGDVSPSPSKNTIPWLYIAIAAAVVFLVAVPGFSFAAKKRKENRGFSGQIVVEIKDEETGVSTEQKVKKLKAFKGEFHLRQLFLLDQEFSETDQITFVPITDNTLLLLNKSSCTIDLGGELIDAETGHRLRRNDKLCIHLPELHKAIYIENVS